MSNSNYDSYYNGLRELSLCELREEYKSVRKVFIQNHGLFVYVQFMESFNQYILETEDLLERGRHILSMLLIENNRYKYIYAYNRWGAFRCWDLGEFEVLTDLPSFLFCLRLIFCYFFCYCLELFEFFIS